MWQRWHGDVKNFMRVVAVSLLAVCGMVEAAVVVLPDPVSDAPLAAKSSSQTAVFAGGCFWGI